ncbi:protein phosphatase 2C 3-like [Impatiens glandulifera]|uniref:protein phosphatase 2C 3-like n=1 Tax=Impatiens glandulifera TaxID=253017 RepID=UPI001FB0F6DF|nr:protein phosphatase 2C 3-like [Impatiens glandulifera]
MAEIPSGLPLQRQASMAAPPPVVRKTRTARRRRMEVRRFKVETPEAGSVQGAEDSPLFGKISDCGRRNDMEDYVALYPGLIQTDAEETKPFHYFAVYDGHGCTHVSKRCRDRFHLLVKEELETKGWKDEWVKAMEKSFFRMDEEAVAWVTNVLADRNCRCGLKVPDCYAVGSTAVVAILTADKIVIANCGDSRAVLCRDGRAVALSIDQKPDRPDELNRIESIGGRVIHWGGARVFGVLAMSRAIGDPYLKPYVTCDPEITITERDETDDFLILASDGLWDVISNEKACAIVRRCMRGKFPKTAAAMEGDLSLLLSEEGNLNKDFTFASMVLAKLAMERGSEDNVSVVVIDLKGGDRINNIRGEDKEE